MNVTQVLNRLKKAYKCANMQELADRLGVAKSTFSSWRKRKVIPDKYIQKCSRLANIDYDWLLGKTTVDTSQVIIGDNNIQTKGNQNLIHGIATKGKYQELFRLIEEYATPKLIEEFRNKLLKIKEIHGQ